MLHGKNEHMTRDGTESPTPLMCGPVMQATVAILDRQMAALRAEIVEQAALAAQTFKFNQGSMQPTGDTSPGRLASGLAATAQVCM